MTKQIAVSLLLTTALLNADTLFLRSGNRVEGHYVGGNDGVIRFAVGNQINTYNVTDVDSVRFYGQQSYGNGQRSAYPQSGSYPPPNPNYPQPTYQGQNGPQGSYPQSSNNNYPQQPNNNYPQSDRYPENDGYPTGRTPMAPPTPNTPSVGYSRSGNGESMRGEVPAGTEIVVRLIDPVDSERNNLGQTYRASVDEAVVVNGQTLIPRGADAVATLIDAQKSGKISGKTVLTLDLKSLTVNNRPYDIATTGVSEASSSRGSRSAKVIGGTAAVGAIIGAIAGGGKGAAIGAGSGAAVGTAAEVATSGQKVKVPAETRLVFTLQNPIAL